MNMNEWNKVREMSYSEYAAYLQQKYGMPTKAYFHTTGADNHLTGGNVSRGKEGLQCHHIREDVVASLSDKNIAAANPIEYQQPENLCYCNLLEHLYLHILIAESMKEDESGKYVGDGGVNWMVLALNSIYSDPSNSWYSKKIDNPEERGLTYNYNNIITDNKDVYLALVNRYCTSAFIRSKFDKTPFELGTELCHVCKKDLNNLPIYNDIMNSLDTKLFEYNVAAFADMEDKLKAGRTALVVICTGGGKTTTALEYVRVHKCKALVLGPSATIGTGWKENKDYATLNYDYMNYQTFMNCYKDIDWNKYAVIICDEAHHTKADRWGEGVRWALTNTDVKVIGLTATPTAEQFDGKDEVFENRICYGLDLADGIDQGLIYKFSYVQSIFRMQDVKAEFDAYGPKGTILWDRLNIALNQNPVEKILKDNMPEGQRKIIVFVDRAKNIDDAVAAMHKYNPSLKVEKINSQLDSKHNEDVKKWFNETTDEDVCIVTVNMVNEGAHYKGVNTLVMFRRTHSTTLYTQQLGRIVVTTNGHEDPHGIVFDFTNNAQNLIYRSKTSLEIEIKSEEEKEQTEEEKEDAIEKIHRVIEQHAGKEVIYKDYTEDCVAMLNALKDAKNVNSTIKKIYSACVSSIETADELEALFDLASWKEFKTTNKGSFEMVRKPHHAVTANEAADYENRAQHNQTTQKATIDASDAEKIATAFKLALRRGYNFGAISFENTAKCSLVVNDKDMFKEIVESIGFRSADKFAEIVSKISHDSYIYAVNLD